MTYIVCWRRPGTGWSAKKVDAASSSEALCKVVATLDGDARLAITVERLP